MRDIWFGRIESIEIRNGQLILEPPPLAIRQVKFGSMQATGLETDSYDYVLTKQAAEFFALIRNIELGKIRSLQITHGVPLLAEFENLPDAFDVEASK